MSANSVIMKQYMNLAKNIVSFSDGQASLSEINNDDDTLETVNITISPNGGYYRSGKFEFVIDIADGYPETNPPRIRCLTEVYHPNIDQIDEYSEGDICLNMLDELWSPELTLEDYVQGLLFMFYEPNPEDPLNPAFCGDEDPEMMSYNIRRSMRGKEVDGTTYGNVLPDGYESDNEETYEEEYDVKMAKNTSQNGSDSISDGESDVSSPSDDILVSTKSDDVITLPTIDEATGQSEPVNVNIKPVARLITIITRVIRFLRPSSSPPTLNGDTAIVRPIWRFVFVSSVAMLAFRIGLRLLIRTPVIFR